MGDVVKPVIAVAEIVIQGGRFTLLQQLLIASDRLLVIAFLIHLVDIGLCLCRERQGADRQTDKKEAEMHLPCRGIRSFDRLFHVGDRLHGRAKCPFHISFLIAWSIPFELTFVNGCNVIADDLLRYADLVELSADVVT